MDGEIVVADNGSIDGSQAISKEYGARVVNVSARGYGAALYFGSLSANGKYIIMGDSDNSYDFSNLDFFVEKLDQGFDLVVGNRFLGGIMPGAMPWKNRYIGNPFLTWVGSTLFNCPLRDFHCGIRGFQKDSFLKMDLRTTGMEFASEMIIKAHLLGMRIAEVPTILSKDGRSRPPHLRPWRDGWRHLRFMLLFSPRWLFLIPGLITLVIGSFFYISIYFQSMGFGKLMFGINTLFYAQTAMTLGLTGIAMAVIVRIFGIREGLLGTHGPLSQIEKFPFLEIGSTLGIFMMLAGVVIGTNLLTQWYSIGFGVLQNGIYLKQVSLSTLLISFGGISLLFSLIIGFLSLPVRRHINKNESN
jgi:glycosyltransferase involved in cell wall biosynthesis